MDLNYFYQQRGESLLRAEAAAGQAARMAHVARAQAYADKIVRFRAARQLAAVRD
jgi:hypothetical protein